MEKKYSVAVFHQSLNKSFGGAASVACWIAESLKDDYNIYILTPDKNIDYGYINSLYGTSLKVDNVNSIEIKLPKIFNKIPHKILRSMKLAICIRKINKKNKNYNLIINTVNECSFGNKSIHYIHFPTRSSITNKNLFSIFRAQIKNINNYVFKKISKFDENKFKSSLVLCNSIYTKNKIKEAYDIEAKVVYPPVVIDCSYEKKPWKDRKNGFISLGRITKNKNIHEIIKIIENINDKHDNNFEFHLVGTGSGKYFESIMNKISNNSIFYYHEKISRSQLSYLLNEYKYGIHGNKFEHFGMAPAEMVMSGMIVFVPDDGGQVEIVNNDKNVVFKSFDDAYNKIDNIINNEDLQKKVLMNLKKTVQSYKIEKFKTTLKMIVNDDLLK